jgi:hypothetical protein
MTSLNQPFPCGKTRREFFTQMGNGFFGTALAGLLAQEGLLASDAPAGSALPRPHHTPKAKACIFMFMVGGPSHLDTFDPKPELVRRHGQNHNFGGASQITQRSSGQLMGSPFRFPRSGQSGLPISEILPNLASCADDLCILRSLHTDTAAHGAACLQMNTGFPRPGFPSMGAWATYGLGHSNQNLPGFVVLGAETPPFGRRLNWASGFLPRRHEGTPFASGTTPLFNLQPASNSTADEQRYQLDLLERLNRQHLERDPGNSELSARISSYELAFRLQASAPETVDLSQESAATQRLYGMHERNTESFGRKCLLARRMVERGVRFVELFHHYWDTHGNNNNEHRRLCGTIDVPMAGLLKDLKARGLLDETLVVWGGEFGRTPIGSGGRDHHANAFSMWVAGGGIKGGTSYGQTDDFGYGIAQNPVHVHDLHATLLHQMGIDHERLTYRHNGRDFRLTDVGGRVIPEIIA